MNLGKQLGAAEYKESGMILTDHLSLSERIFKVIEEAILSSSLKPGERIIETELAKTLGTSKSPVREALKRLEGEGIVRYSPRKGYYVREIDRKSIDDFFDAMFVIEPVAAVKSLTHRNKQICDEIDSMLKEMEVELRSKNYKSYLVLNDRFHKLFHKTTDNEWIIKFSQMLRKQAEMLRSLSLYTKDRFSRSIEEHRAIGEAYKAGNEEMLTAAVKTHLVMFKDNILKSEYLKHNS